MGKCARAGRVIGWITGAAAAAGLFASVAVFASVAAGSAQAAECAENRVDLRGDWGTARFTVELADDEAERALGLMNREHLAGSAGMLFIYPGPRRVAFWMENTLIPLDMIFLDAAGRVRRVAADAVPLDRTPIDGGPGILAVLEINGGLAARLGIVPGTELRHPAFGPDAAWPCN
ncbi:DUF192 domain-containing protein [Rhodovulum sulfidophilum]|uniref:DUF192 domain-containing protein n=1 Tax=Rhodovulum sulfidophilum TaxID=35806 RepID=UPI0009D779B1|nr:DUF192 domain-containing protein [Rhodovulum sulfidophilum]MBL3551746.1 DUF192 domain-containing protein [Rhodovulum sulfidophilum]